MVGLHCVTFVRVRDERWAVFFDKDYVSFDNAVFGLPCSIGILFGTRNVGKRLIKFVMTVLVALVVSQVPANAYAGGTTVTAVSPTGVITTSSPTFTWAAESLASTYRLIILNAKKISVLDQTYTAAASNCSGGSGNCSVTPSLTLSKGSYSWYVWADNGVSKPWITTSFSVTPANQSPGYPSGQLSAAPSAFYWGAVTGASDYFLTVTKVGGTSTTKWVSAAQGGCSSGTGVCSTSIMGSLTSGTYNWTVQPYISSLRAATTTATFTISSATLKTPVPGSPSGTVATLTPSFSWSAVSGVAQYRLRVTDSTNTQVIDQTYTASAAGCAAGTGSCTVAPGTTLALGNGSWTIQSLNTAAGTQSTESSKLTFTIVTPVGTPGTPVPIAPAGTVTTTSPTFSWNAASNANSYVVRVTDASSAIYSRTITATAAGCPSAPGTCQANFSNSLVTGAGSWTVQAFNTDYNLTGSVSNSLAFTISTGSSASALLVSPLSGTLSTNTPSFVWNAVAGTTSYYLSVVNYSTGAMYYSANLTPAAAGCAAGTGTCTVSPGVTLPTGVAKWSVLASPSNISGEAKITVPAPALSTPVTISPTGTTSGVTPSFSWNAVQGATSYRLRVIDATKATVIDQTLTSTAVSCASGTGTCSVSPGVTLALGSGYWTVMALNTTNNTQSAESGQKTFTIVTAATTPGVPTLVSPNGATVSLSPVFTWNATTNADGYTIRVTDSSSTTVTRSISATLAGCATATTCTYSFPATFAAGSGTWTVQATNSSTNLTGQISSSMSFTLSAPSVAAVIIAPTGTIYEKSPTFSWNAINGISQYIVRVQSVTTIPNTFLDATYTATQLGCPGGTGVCSLTPTPSLQLAAGSYIWSVITLPGVATYQQKFTVSSPLLSLSPASVAENVTIPAQVGTLSSSDPTAGSATYSIIGGSDASSFEIKNNNQLWLKSGVTLSYRTQSSYSLIVSGGGSTQGVTVQITEANKAPTDIVLSATSVDENKSTATNLTVATLTAVDPNINTAFLNHVFTITGGADQAKFTISGSSLQIVAGTVLSYSAATNHALQVEITATDAGGLAFAKSVSFAINNVAPTAISLSPGIAYTNANNTLPIDVGTLTVTDPDPYATVSCSVTGGTDQSSFQITGMILQLKVGTVLNVTTKPSYSVQVTCANSGGLSLAKTLTVTVQEVNQAPTDISLSNTLLPFIGRSSNALVGTLTATDPNTKESFTYSLLDSFSGRFSITGDQLFVVETTTPVHGVFALPIRVTDSGGLTFDKTFTITVVGFTVETIPSTPTVATRLADSRSTYANIYNELVTATPGQQVTVSADEFANMVVGKAAQQLTSAGLFTPALTDIVPSLSVQITNSLITATMQVALVDQLYSRLSAATRSVAQSIFDTFAPYAAGYKLSVRLRIKPVISGLNVSLDTNSSYVDIVNEPTYIPTVSIAMGTLITAYNSMVNALASNDSLAFFLGGGARPAAHFLRDSLGNSNTANKIYQSNLGLALDAGASRATNTLVDRSLGGLLIPLSQRVDYYFPGLIDSVAIGTNSVTLTRSSLNVASLP